MCSCSEREYGEDALKIMELFVNHPNFDVNYKDGNGFALIHYCVRMQNCQFLEILLRSGRRDVNVNILFGVIQNNVYPDRGYSTYNACTALNILFKNRFPSCHIKLQLLLEHGADPNIVGRDGYGPIHNLIRYYGLCPQDEFCNDIRLLLPTTANTTIANVTPNIPQHWGNLGGFTPLHLALNVQCPLYVFEELLRGGADPTLRNSAGRKALEYADDVDIHNDAVKRLLMDNDPEFQEMKQLAGLMTWKRLGHNRDLYSKIYRESGFKRV